MFQVYPVLIGPYTCIAVDVALPKTRLLAIRSETGYIMCGALDVALLNEKLSDRGIIAGRAVGVRTIDDLLSAPLESVTREAQKIGIEPGTIGRDALRIMCEHAESCSGSTGS
ncbi:MAG: DUF1805 domain-containing protein [Firmicutes bacterium]|nr:DUF1805 domain-containing protein [Bacillota bacterium]